MSVRSGFYPSKKAQPSDQYGDRRYFAREFNFLIGSLIKDGVISGVDGNLLPSIGTQGRNILIQPGLAWLNLTWTRNETVLPVEVPEAHAVLDRWDAIVIDVDTTDATRWNDIYIISGVPDTTPEKPALINTPTRQQFPICYYLTEKGTTTLSASKLENMIGQEPLPFATGILETVDTTALIQQWGAQFAEFMADNANLISNWNTQWLAWFNGTKQDWTEWLDTADAALITWGNQFATWMSEKQVEYNAWIAQLQEILDENTAGNLLNLINALDTRVDDVETDVSTINTTITAMTPDNATTTLYSYNWSGTGPYTYSVSFAGVLSSSTVLVGPNVSDSLIEMWQKANIVMDYTYTNGFRLKAHGEKPTSNLGINMTAFNRTK